MRLYVVLTSFNEPETVGKAVEQVICPNRELWPNLRLVITAPDEPTLTAAEKVCQEYEFHQCVFITDAGEGKPAALNLAVDTITTAPPGISDGDLLILTDGDMYLADGAIKSLLNVIADSGSQVVGAGGHPVSLDSRNSQFGYYSHLFCEAAHIRRQKEPATPMSGYLYAIRAALLPQLFPLPANVRAEDAYISQKVLALGYKLAYVPEALAYVNFPKNMGDWFKQKTRSLGGNVQVGRGTVGGVGESPRSVVQDLQMALFPLTFAKSPKELIWSLLLYPLRLLLWIRIYINHLFNRYHSGAWQRVESSKY